MARADRADRPTTSRSRRRPALLRHGARRSPTRSTTLASAGHARRSCSRYRFDDAGWVANRWCEILPIPLAAKQKLMELPDPVVRLRAGRRLPAQQGRGRLSATRRGRERSARCEQQLAQRRRQSRRASALVAASNQRPSGHARDDRCDLRGRGVRAAASSARGCSVQSRCVSTCVNARQPLGVRRASRRWRRRTPRPTRTPAGSTARPRRRLRAAAPARRGRASCSHSQTCSRVPRLSLRVLTG